MVEVLTEKPEIIFTTAYDQFALRAFELNAVDYLMKPFPKRRFLEAVKKAIDKIQIRIKEIKNLQTSFLQKYLNQLLLLTGLLYVKAMRSILYLLNR